MSQQRTQSFGKSLFLGDLREELIFPFPQPHLAEQKKLTALLDEVRKLAKRTIDPRRIDADAHIPDEVLAGLRELGIFGLLTQPQLGGAGFSLSATARVIDLLGSFDSSVAMLVAVHLGFAVLAIQNFGTSEQRQRYLPRLSKGHSIGAFAVAEPLAGSDSAAIRTRAERKGDKYIVNGQKTWTTLGQYGDWMFNLVRTSSDSPAPRSGFKTASWPTC